MQDNNILKISGLSKSFPGVKALEEVDMDVKEGEIHALLGENGSGKSTLTKCIVGAYHKDSGVIYFDGKEVNFSSPAESFKSGITVIYQERSLIPKLTVEQNVFLGGEVVNNGVLDKKEMIRKYNSLCENFGFDLPPNLKINRLGVAQQKVVEIMKALARKSKLVIMDEPTASLSKQEAEHLFEIIQRLKERNISILYITHILEEVFQITDRITVLRDGKKISTLKTNETNQDEIVGLMVGEVLDEKVFLTSHAKYEAEPIISVKNFVNKPRVNNVSFEVYEGEVLGITGLTGAGKTELARAMFGADTVEKGTLIINGETAKFKTPTDAIKSGIALVPEDRKTDGLILLFEVFKNITLPSLEEFSNKLSVLNKKKELEKTDQFKNRLNIRLSSEYQQTKFLSGGNQQKVVIAKWLLTNPRLLILDEATQGIDVKAKREIYLIVRELAKTGVAIIFISSEVQDIYRVSDRIIVLRNGKITGEFKRGAPQEEILKNVVGGKPTLDD